MTSLRPAALQWHLATLGIMTAMGHTMNSAGVLEALQLYSCHSGPCTAGRRSFSRAGQAPKAAPTNPEVPHPVSPSLPASWQPAPV